MSAMVVPKAAEAALVNGVDIREFITNHPIDRDFHMRAKVPRASTLVMCWPELDFEQELANIVRYYVSVDGGQLFKKSPPTGVHGSWKRRAKLTDAYFNEVQRELLDSVNYADAGGMLVFDNATNRWLSEDDMSVVYECDSQGVPWDARIHTGNKSKHAERVSGISAGWLCTDCSDVSNFDRSTINYEYYIKEAEKLVNPLLTGSSK